MFLFFLIRKFSKESHIFAHPPQLKLKISWQQEKICLPPLPTLGGRHINTLHFSQHSRGLNTFKFSANNLKKKKNSHLETSFRQVHCCIKHCILISIHAWLFFEICSVSGQKFGNESKIGKKFSITLLHSLRQIH